MSKPYEGLFVTIEGGEGAGKSTLSKTLAHALQERGYKLHLTREPGGTILSEKVRELLLEKSDGVKIGPRAELLLFLAARAQHLDEVILPKLRAGELVICERFSDSTIAYQGCGRHLGKEEVEKLCHFAAHEIEPDCTLFIDIDPKEGMRRVQKGRKNGLDRLESEEIQFHNEVRQGFLHLVDQYPQRISILDGSLSKEALLEKALIALEPHLLLKPTLP